MCVCTPVSTHKEGGNTISFPTPQPDLSAKDPNHCAKIQKLPSLPPRPLPPCRLFPHHCLWASGVREVEGGTGVSGKEGEGVQDHQG